MEKDKVTMLRRRTSKLAKVKQLDIFPKIQETYKETSPVGGTFSIISFLIIVWLVYSEIVYYLDSKFVFKFSPDTDFNAKLRINVDLTVAMPCKYLGADILDSTNQNAFKFGALDEEDTWFDLAPNQQIHFDNKKHFNSYLREEYHAVKDLLWRSSFSSSFGDMPARSTTPERPHDACRIHGSLVLNKVSGNFHITAGKSLNLPRGGHIHISGFMGDRDYNFSHRINRFSFGDASPGIIHPLEGDEQITNNGINGHYSRTLGMIFFFLFMAFVPNIRPNSKKVAEPAEYRIFDFRPIPRMTLFNYFIEVVPTDVQTFLTTINTYQYSVKELSRPIDHDKGSHGMPGIFFKYDVSALKVTVKQERDHFGMFLAKLCSIAGGIYVCSGFLARFVFLFLYLVSRKPTTSDKDTKIHHQSVPDVVPSTL